MSIKCQEVGFRNSTQVRKAVKNERDRPVHTKFNVKTYNDPIFRY